MARRRYRKNPIRGGVTDFFNKIQDEGDMCGVPLKLIVIGRNQMNYTLGQVDKKSIVIDRDICLGVLSNLAVIAHTINYVLENQEEKAKYIDINSLNLIFEKRGGRYSAKFTMSDDTTEVGTLVIYKLTDLRNMTSIKSMLTEALKVKRLGLDRVPSLVDKGIKEVRSEIASLDRDVVDGSITWATQPEGPTEQELLNATIDSVEDAQTQTDEALNSEDIEELVEARTSIEAAIDDAGLMQDVSEDPELDRELEGASQELEALLQDIEIRLRSFEEKIQQAETDLAETDLFGDEITPSSTTTPRPKRKSSKKKKSQSGGQGEIDFDAPPPPPPPKKKAWSFEQTDVGVTAVRGPNGAVKNVFSLLQAKLDQYAADEQLYGIDVKFKVEEKSSGSVSASRRGKTITVKVNGAPSISDLINAVSTPLAAIYDEQDIDFDEDGFGLAQELEWS